MEVLASVVLLAVVLSISLSIFPNMFRTNDLNQESLDAVAVAKDALVRAKSGELVAAEFKKISDSPTVKSFFPSDQKPSDSHYTFTTNSPLTGNYKVYYIIDPLNVDNLGLFKLSIYVVERDAIRATNYGYVDRAAKPASVVEVVQ